MLRTLTTLLAVLVLALAGCGGDDEESGGSGGGGGGGGGGGAALTLAAPEDGALVFEPTELTAPAGQITIDFDNPASVPHAVAIDGADAESETVTGSSTTLSANLEAGEYTFYCPVAGHREAGMEGTLTVE